jgi:hypothetical protein
MKTTSSWRLFFKKRTGGSLILEFFRICQNQRIFDLWEFLKTGTRGYENKNQITI